MQHTPRIHRLIEALRCLPGVGPKSAQRMAYQLLERNRDGGVQLAEALSDAMQHVGRCQRCRTLSEADLCQLCGDATRDQQQLCIVETPSDVWAVDQATGFRGLYFVLTGHLSPLDGIGPAELGLDQLQERFAGGNIGEVIVATNPTVEGEATAHFIAEMAREQDIRCTRLAHGIPIGGELEYIDGGTLSHAFAGRREL